MNDDDDDDDDDDDETLLRCLKKLPSLGLKKNYAN